MIRALSIVSFALFCSVFCVGWRAEAQPPSDKERTGTVSGELKSRTEAKKGKSVTLEVLAPGEEKARRYLVSYNPRDPKAEAPFKDLLVKVNKAKVGDHVRITWVNTPKGSEGGFFVTDFEVLKKGGGKGAIDRKK